MRLCYAFPGSIITIVFLCCISVHTKLRDGVGEIFAGLEQVTVMSIASYYQVPTLSKSLDF